MSNPSIRYGQAPEQLPHDEFVRRFEESFLDPRFDTERAAIRRVAEIAWQNYDDGRKAPLTAPAGPGHADPEYELSTEWRETSERLRVAEAKQGESSTPSRALLVVGSPRNDGTCPGEMSKTARLAALCREILEQGRVEVDVLDLSWISSEYGRRIHPCKGCVSTAMPLCHWPCSCYPNHGQGQTGDWMAEIYERWTAAHGVLIVTPVHWYHAPSVLKLMMDRLVCADGGNSDPTSTHGKDAEAAKQLELAGWSYPKHLAGRAYGVIVHGDAAGAEVTRRSLSDWLDTLGLIDAGTSSRLDRYVGYYEPYATSHDALDIDQGFQEETSNVARALLEAIRRLREGRLAPPDAGLSDPRPK